MVTNCRAQRDICTVENFKRYEVQQVECPGPCETYSITDPNGELLIFIDYLKLLSDLISYPFQLFR